MTNKQKVRKALMFPVDWNDDPDPVGDVTVMIDDMMTRYVIDGDGNVIKTTTGVENMPTEEKLKKCQKCWNDGFATGMSVGMPIGFFIGILFTVLIRGW